MFSSVTYYLQEKHIKDLVELKRILLNGGAKKEFYLSSLVQYVICDDEDTAKRIEGDVKEANPEAVIVKSDWIMLSSKCGVLLPYELFTYSGEKMFSGLTFCPSGLSHVDCAKLWTMVQYNGGKWQKKLDSTVTHLVTCSATSTRYQCAVEHGVNVVTPDWILDCDSHSTRLSESLYHPSLFELEDQAAVTTPTEIFNGPSSVVKQEEKTIVTRSEVTESFQKKLEEKEKCLSSTSTEETIAESNTHLELKPKVWNEDSTSYILEGITFYITDYPQCVGEETIEKWKKVIYSHGGMVSDHYDAIRCTHLLAQRSSSEICRKALADGRCISSAYWLNHVLTTGVMHAPSNPLHFPATCTGKVDNPQNYSVTLTNYLGTERRLVKDMIKSTGLPFTGFLSKQTTHLICKCVGGKKYEKALEWGLKIVNSKFIGDIMFTGQIPELSKRHIVLNEDDEFIVTHPKAFSMLEPWHLFLQHHYNQPQYFTESLKRGRNSDNEDDNSNKRAKVTSTEDLVSGGTGDVDDIQAGGSNTMAPSQIQQPRIVFTGVSGAMMGKMKEIINRLGGIEVDAKQCTHLVTSKLTRTIKFLCAISVAKHMVTTDWINKSDEAGYFLDEAQFMLTDQYAESIYGFNVSTSLREAQSKKLLQGLTFFCTPQVIPSPESLRDIIECSGGELISLHTLQMLDTKSKTLKAGLKLFKKPLIVLTCVDDLDSEELAVFDEAGIGIYNTEFVMTGVVRQRLDYDVNRMKPTAKKEPYTVEY